MRNIKIQLDVEVSPPAFVSNPYILCFIQWHSTSTHHKWSRSLELAFSISWFFVKFFGPVRISVKSQADRLNCLMNVLFFWQVTFGSVWLLAKSQKMHRQWRIRAHYAYVQVDSLNLNWTRGKIAAVWYRTLAVILHRSYNQASQANTHIILLQKTLSEKILLLLRYIVYLFE